MADDGGRWLSISVAMRTGKRWTLATLSSHAVKAGRLRPPRPAVDARTPGRCRRKQACCPNGRRGLGVDRNRASAIRSVGTIGATEGMSAVSGTSTGRARRPMSVAPHSSSFSSNEVSQRSFGARLGSHSGDPGVEDLNAHLIERHHVGAIARREMPEPMSEAKKLGRIDRGKAQRGLEPDVKQMHAIAYRARHIEHGARERAVVPCALSVLHRDFFAVEGKTRALATDWRHGIGHQYGPCKPAQRKTERR